jgi:hypothetical protein
MATSAATTVEEYLAELPPERREAIEAVRAVILEHLPEGFREEMTFGMIGYVIPLERYPETYNRQPLGLAALASQKNYMSLYLHGLYADEEALEGFLEAYRATGKRLDIGKSCVRFRKLEDLPLDVVADAIAAVPVDDYIALYEASRRR